MKLKKIYEQVLGETEKLGFLAYHGSPTDFKKFSDEFVGGDEATDQEGPGVYFTTNRENAAAYGGNLYTAKLNGNFITDESASDNANEAHIEQLIRMAEDWQSHAQNWGEDPESAIYSSISDMFEYNDNEKDVFLQVWIEYYRYDAVNFVRNMTKLGYDGVVVDRTDDRGMNKHIIVYNPSTITLTDKEVISEELTYRHADGEGPEDDEYEIGMVKEDLDLSSFRFNDGKFNKEGANTIYLDDNPIIDFGVGQIGQVKVCNNVWENSLYLQGGFNASEQRKGYGRMGLEFIFTKLPKIQYLILQCLDTAKPFWVKMGAKVICQKPYSERTNKPLYTMVISRDNFL